ncbi:hypothetical protein E2C01_056483 [Portunus trituberculatus]|uniref:Uncharacterized protein n=1 Tax=Portunus trituberculatus TaxID=210409 RepID=A0A5B7GZQ6_PORTR|nr:hypothetical protein [Portunus trituberculatus]
MFQYFRELVDLVSLPQPRQLIQLRMCPSLETQRVLEYTLLVPPYSTSINKVLDMTPFNNTLRIQVVRLYGGRHS